MDKRTFGWIGAGLISACATASSISEERPAALTSADDPSVREEIRLYVRDIAGPEYIANLEELTTLGRVIASDRARGTMVGQPIINESIAFIVVMARSGDLPICLLKPATGKHEPLSLAPELCVERAQESIR